MGIGHNSVYSIFISSTYSPNDINLISCSCTRVVIADEVINTRLGLLKYSLAMSFSGIRPYLESYQKLLE